ARAGEYVGLRERGCRGELVRLQHAEVDVEDVAVDDRLHEGDVVAGAERRNRLVDRLRRVVRSVGEEERLDEADRAVRRDRREWLASRSQDAAAVLRQDE